MFEDKILNPSQKVEYARSEETQEAFALIDSLLHTSRFDLVCRARVFPLLWPFSQQEALHFRERVDRLLLRQGQQLTTGISYFTKGTLHCFLLRSKRDYPSSSGDKKGLVSCDILAFDSKQQKLHLRFHRDESWKRLSYPVIFGEIFYGDFGHFTIRRHYHLERAVACDNCIPAGHQQIKSVSLVAFSIMEYDGNATEVFITARKNADQILHRRFWPLSHSAVLKMLKFRVSFRDGATRTYCVYADRISGSTPYNDYALCFEEFMAMTGVLEVPDAIDEF